MDNLNVKALLPHLIEKGLLARWERERIESWSKSEYELNSFVLNVLYHKREEGFKRFLQCLRDENEHLGHKELVTALGLSIQQPIHV